MSEIATHPVQSQPRNRKPATAPVVMTLRAYEVYCRLYGPQQSLVTGNCRGGFSANELAAFLYARSFPESEWRERVDEAMEGLNL